MRTPITTLFALVYGVLAVSAIAEAPPVPDEAFMLLQSGVRVKSTGVSLREVLKREQVPQETIDAAVVLGADLDAPVVAESRNAKKRDTRQQLDVYTMDGTLLRIDAENKRLMKYVLVREPIEEIGTELTRGEIYAILNSLNDGLGSRLALEPHDLVECPSPAPELASRATYWECQKARTYYGVRTQSVVYWRFSNFGKLLLFLDKPLVKPPSMEVTINKDQAKERALKYARKNSDLSWEYEKAELLVAHPNNLLEKGADEAPRWDETETRLCWEVVLSAHDGGGATVGVLVDCAEGEIVGAAR